VKAGGEATGIDLKLSLSKKGYEARGRVVDESGNGVAGVMIMCQPARDEATTSPGFSGFSGQAHTNSKGEFKFDGVHPGKYTVSVFTMFDEANLYGDVATFEITNSDTGGIEIKTHKGLSASGIAVIEGHDDPSVSAQLPQVQLMAVTAAAAESAAGFGMSRSTVAPDGSFTITGLRPGKVMIMTSPMAADSSFSILRIERGGVAQNEGIDITPDSPVNDIKVIMGYRNCSIHGRVVLSGGTIPKGTGLNVFIRRLGSEQEGMSSGVEIHNGGRAVSTFTGLGSGTSAQFTVSPGGDFRADRLVAGDYEVTVIGPGSGAAEPKSASQKVTLISGAQLEVNLVLDLASNK
jgi:hypothetical protein